MRIQYNYEVSEVKAAQLCLTLRPHRLQPTRLLCPWDSPGKNTGVGYHFILQGIFPARGLNLGLSHCRQVCHLLSHRGGELGGESRGQQAGITTPVSGL